MSDPNYGPSKSAGDYGHSDVSDEREELTFVPADDSEGAWNLLNELVSECCRSFNTCIHACKHAVMNTCFPQLNDGEARTIVLSRHKSYAVGPEVLHSFKVNLLAGYEFHHNLFYPAKPYVMSESGVSYSSLC
jgi:hypothetical protein